MCSAVTYITAIYAASFIITPVNGFARRCNVNQTLFVPEGSNATFQVNITYDFGHIKFIKESRSLFVASLRGRVSDGDDIDIDIYYSDHDFEKRSDLHIHGQGLFDTPATLTITVTDVGTADNGTYNVEGFPFPRVCWILFVMEITQRPVGVVEEYQPVYLFAHPVPSLMVRPLVNASVVWLLNGMEQTANYVEQEGSIWIARVTRGMDGMTVTYRSVQDNGFINEVNYTLDVAYGPSGPLLLTPSKTQYFLSSGELMTNIACTTECKPHCTVTWGEHSQDSILNLGKVTSKNTGEYTCTATRTGSNVVVERRIVIYVADNAAFTFAITALASVLVLTVGIGICSTCFLLRKKTSSCQPCHKLFTSKAPSTAVTSDSPGDTAVTSDSQGDSTQNAFEFEHYEDLKPETRQTPADNLYGLVSPTGSQSNDGVEVYENTQIA